MEDSKFTIEKDLVHCVFENGKLIAVIRNDSKAHRNVASFVTEMHGDDLGTFIGRLIGQGIIPNPEPHEK